MDDGRDERLTGFRRVLVPAASVSRWARSFITGKSGVLGTLVDSRSFHILPS